MPSIHDMSDDWSQTGQRSVRSVMCLADLLDERYQTHVGIDHAENYYDTWVQMQNMKSLPFSAGYLVSYSFAQKLSLSVFSKIFYHGQQDVIMKEKQEKIKRVLSVMFKSPDLIFQHSFGDIMNLQQQTFARKGLTLGTIVGVDVGMNRKNVKKTKFAFHVEKESVQKQKTFNFYYFFPEPKWYENVSYFELETSFSKILSQMKGKENFCVWVYHIDEETEQQTSQSFTTRNVPFDAQQGVCFAEPIYFLIFSGSNPKEKNNSARRL